MSEKESAPKDVIEGYRKRQQSARRAPLVLGIAAALVIIGAGAVIFWLFGSGGSGIALFASDTPTPTETFTPTPTALPTNTPTVTATDTPVPTETLTPTVAGPFEYIVQEGDSCYSIALEFEVDILLLITINNLDPTCPIKPGDVLIIPGPDTALPSATPLPTNLPPGTRIEYTVQPGDSLGSIALKFNSTEEAIIEENDIEDPNNILVGQVLIIPVNIVTPVPTSTPLPATSTPTP